MDGVSQIYEEVIILVPLYDFINDFGGRDLCGGSVSTMDLMRMYKHTVEDGYVEVATLWKCKEILAMTTWGRVELVSCVRVGQDVEFLKRAEERPEAWLDRRYRMVYW